MLSLATILCFRLWSKDMSFAYIQGAKKIRRRVYLKRSPEFQLANDQLLEILRLLYGLSDPEDYWHATFVKHMERSYDAEQGVRFVTILSHRSIKTARHDGNERRRYSQREQHSMFFQQLTRRLLDAKTREYYNLTFAEVTIATRNDGSLLMHQADYAKKIQLLDKRCTYEQFRSRRHELAWLTNMRPDGAAEPAIRAQVTALLFKPTNVAQLNQAIKRVKNEPQLRLIIHKLEKETLNIVVHADASVANLSDLITQLDFVILLNDHTKRVTWMQYCSYKFKRIVRSVIGGETHAFVDSFDAAYAIRHDTKKMLQKSI